MAPSLVGSPVAAVPMDIVESRSSFDAASPAEASQAERDTQLLSSSGVVARARSGTLVGDAPGAAPPHERRQSDAYDHLADDLTQQDSFYYNPAATTPSSARRSVQAPHSQQTLYHAHALSQNFPASAARFRQRNLSDSSIDSHGGAYIDHRRHAPFLPASASRTAGASGGMRAQTTRRNFETAERDAGPSARRVSDCSSAGGRSPSPSSPSRNDEQSHSAISTGTLRQRLTSADLEEHAIEDDDERLLPRDALQRHGSRNYRQTSAANSPALERRNSYSNELSRAGSINGKAEEDVCFPVHGETDLDIGMDSLHPEEHVHHHHHHHGQGVAGVLHNFPFPFDFGALEEFAERERDAVPIPAARKVLDGGAGLSISPPGYSSGTKARADGGSSVRQTIRQRKLSESVAPGRVRQNLFDGLAGGDEDAMAELRARAGAAHASILDVKTPLLPTNAPAQAYGGYGSGNSGSGPAPGASAARPYRFSFYSNALPSTIHARSLAEIPAEGQTFEELFVGHQTDYTEEDSYSATAGGTAFSPPGTGVNTPVYGQPPRESVNGARPGGIAQASATERNKAGRMRSEVDAESNSWWLDVLCPTDQEMKVLSKVFGIHPLTTEDIQMEETREKIELFRNYYFVCFRSFEQDPYSPTYLEPLNMYIIVFREGTLSFHFRGTPHPQNVRRRIKQLKDYINVTSDWISYALIDDITDAFGPLIQNIEYEVDSIDELVLILKEAEQSDMLRRIGTCRKKVMGLLRLMGNKADVVKGLSKRCNENWSVAPKSDIGLYLSDIQDHITTSTQNLTHYEKILSRSHSNYLAQISIEMTDANNEINNVLSKLTALGTILIPLNLITGLWGMNVHVPGQDVTEGYTWFFSIIGCLAAVAIIGAYLSFSMLARK